MPYFAASFFIKKNKMDFFINICNFSAYLLIYYMKG